MNKAKFAIIFILIPISLIFASYYGISAGTKLRETKAKNLNEQNVKRTIEKYNFFDKKLNEKGNFTNDLVDNGDGTVTDQATGLMWEKKGSKKVTSWYFAKKYVKKLNKKKFAGHNDWRIPSIEELYSLLEPISEKQLYIHPVFATKGYHFWSTDTSAFYIRQPDGGRTKHLTIDYRKGTVSEQYEGDYSGGGTLSNLRSFVRVVRTIQ